MIAGVVFLLLGLVGIYVGVYALRHEGLKIYYEERFIIGKCYLQLILGEAKALLQLPFDNIQTLSMEKRVIVHPRGQTTTYFIGIKLKEIKRADVIIHRAGLVGDVRQWGFNVIIRDQYEVSLPVMHKAMETRWKAVLRGEDSFGRQERDYEEAEQKRRQNSGKRKGMILVAFGFMAAVFLIGFCGFSLALLLRRHP